MRPIEFNVAERNCKGKLLYPALLVCLALSATAKPAKAIVLIDDFNFNDVSRFGSGAPSGGNPAGQNGIEYTPNHFGDLGQGTIGNGAADTGARRFGTTANGQVTIDSGSLNMTLHLGAGSKASIIAWDTTGTALGALVSAPAALAFGVGTNTLNLNYANVLGGNGLLHDASGLILGGANAVGLGSNTSLKIGVFASATEYAYFSVAGNNINGLINGNGDIYIPFTNPPYSGTNTPTVGFIHDTIGSTTLTLSQIFDQAKAVVLILSTTSGGTGTLSLNSIYAFTPEPASLVIWSLFVVVGMSVGCRRRKPSCASTTVESAAALA